MKIDTSRAVGALYVLGFIVGIAGSIMGTPGPLESVVSRRATIACGALLWVVAALGDAAHGVLLFPLLKRSDERLALGYLGARLVEAAVVAVSALFTLLQIPLSVVFKATVAAAELFQLQVWNKMLLSAQEYAYQVGMIALGAAGLTLTIGLYRSKLLPRSLSVWGFLGYVCFLVGSMLEVLGMKLQLVHTLPGGLWEISVGIWLMIKGFSVAPSSVQNEGSAQ